MQIIGCVWRHCGSQREHTSLFIIQKSLLRLHHSAQHAYSLLDAVQHYSHCKVFAQYARSPLAAVHPCSRYVIWHDMVSSLAAVAQHYSRYVVWHDMVYSLAAAAQHYSSYVVQHHMVYLLAAAVQHCTPLPLNLASLSANKSMRASRHVFDVIRTCCDQRLHTTQLRTSAATPWIL